MEKLHIRDQSYSAAPVCIYKYDQTGNIVNSNVTFYGMPASPMKYRDIRSRRSEIPRKLRSPSIPRSYPDLSFRSKLDVNMYNREVFVIRDGTYLQDKDKVEGFHYKFTLIQKFDRYSHSEEMKAFFGHCSKKFHTRLNFKFLFDSAGKLLRCLHELSHEGKIVLVGTKPKFQGVRDCSLNEDDDLEAGENNLRYVAMQKINSGFRIKTCKSRNSSFGERAAPAKICKKIDEKITFNDLKVKLGNVSYNIDRTFPTLCSQGIQKIKSKYNFNEKELHNLYGKFKLLVLLSCGIDRAHKIESGISKSTFVDYYSKSPELSHILSKIFDKFDLDGGGTVSWEEFLEAMNVIWHGTIEDQLDFFFAVYDNDGNGRLSFNEIQELCRLQLQMEKADNLLDELSYSFATLIFDLTETSYTEEIPSDKIKEIIRKQQDKSLIEMFCSFNCLKFFRILALWTALYFVEILNCTIIFWSWMGKGRYFIRFSLLGIKLENEFHLFDSVLHEFEGLEEENLLWVEKIGKFRNVGIIVMTFNVISAGFVVWWEKVKYYKQVSEWGIKEKGLICLGFLFKALPAFVWWDGTQSSRTGNCEVLFVNNEIQDPCNDIGFVLEIVCIFGFIINAMISIVT